MSKNNDYTTGNLLHYEHYSKHYNLIAIYLSKLIELEKADLRQQINLIGKPEENNRATIFFIIEKSEKATFNFSESLVRILQNGNWKNCKFIKWFKQLFS